MKRVLLLLFVVSMAVIAFAADVIITKDSPQINAKIEEIGLETVTYRLSDNPNGTLYTLAKTDILTILYENGSVETFQQKQESQSGYGQMPVPNYGEYGYNQFVNPKHIVRSGHTFSKNGVTLSRREYENLLQNTCPEAFQQYKKGKTLTNTGWVLLAGGPIIATAIGIPVFFAGIGPNTWKDNDMGAVGGGIALITIGGAATVASIPLLCVGYSKRHRSVDMYNSMCTPTITYNITTGQNSIGLAIHF